MVSENISTDILNMALRQLGATSIESTFSKLNLIKFEIIPVLTLSYICVASDDEKIYLTRLSPYPVQNVRFESIDTTLEFISRDIILFKNAALSSKYSEFINISHKSFEVREEIENFFLFHNVDDKVLHFIEEKLDEILDHLNTAEKIHLDEIENLDESNIPKHEVEIEDL